MELGGYGFEKTELLKITEEIYELKGKKQAAELQLGSEQFHYEYIPKRKQLAEHEVVFKLLWIIPTSLLVLASLVIVVYFYFNTHLFKDNGPLGVLYLFAMLTLVFGGYTAFRLWKREIHMLTLLYISKNPERSSAYIEKHEIHTFQKDEMMSKKRIEMLEEEIASLSKRIEELTKKQEEILDHKNKTEELLKNHDVISDKQTDNGEKSGKFSLKQDSLANVNIQELFEYYSKEESYIKNHLRELDARLQQLNKSITKIDDDFEQAKRTCVLFGGIYIFIVLIQSVFTGYLASFTSLLCIIISLGLFFYVERKCKKPIILYLIENEKPVIQEYAFARNMLPVKFQRKEILDMMNGLQMTLDEIREKKKLLDA